jgi:ATPase subunit of ABC transporter with duplicated ATPase domains
MSSRSDDIENNRSESEQSPREESGRELRDDSRRSKTKKKSSKSKDRSEVIKKGSKKGKDEKGAIEDIRLPTQLMEYGVPVDVGKRVITFSDVDKSVYDGVTELPYCPTPWNFIFARRNLILKFIRFDRN